MASIDIHVIRYGYDARPELQADVDCRVLSNGCWVLEITYGQDSVNYFLSEKQAQYLARRLAKAVDNPVPA